MNKFIKSYKKFCFKEYNFSKYTLFLILMSLLVFGGVFGFIYEVLFYRLDLGYFVKRGTTFGPWIPIYAFGSVLITLITYKFKKKPLYVFLISTIVCGLLEFTTGYLLFHISHLRLWDYNNEIFNYLNIGGYICLRSVLFFGLSGLFLVYVVIPLYKLIASKLNTIVLSIITLIPGILFLIDFIVSDLIK